MESEQKQVNLNFGASKPIFADEIALVHKIKATKNEKGEIEKEGQVMFMFTDTMTGRVLGEFVITKNTARALAKMLPANMDALEKQLADKSIPKKQEVKTTSDPSYR